MRGLATGCLAIGFLGLAAVPAKSETLSGLLAAGYEIKAAVAVGNESSVFLQKGTSAFQCNRFTCTRLN